MVISSIHASNILVIAPTHNVGTFLYFEEFVRNLLVRGHKVTGITSYNLKNVGENFTQITIPLFNVHEHCKKVQEVGSMSKLIVFLVLRSFKEHLWGKLRRRESKHLDELENWPLELRACLEESASPGTYQESTGEV